MIILSVFNSILFQLSKHLCRFCTVLGPRQNWIKKDQILRNSDPGWRIIHIEWTNKQTNAILSSWECESPSFLPREGAFRVCVMLSLVWSGQSRSLTLSSNEHNTHNEHMLCLPLLLQCWRATGMIRVSFSGKRKVEAGIHMPRS
jgi:hypothetical protein